MMQNYDKMIQEKAQVVFMEMEERVSTKDMVRIHEAFELAREAHAEQKRKSGEPYIIHPIAVATIVAIELKLGANPVIAAFLHDVVEDTDYTMDDIRQRFGDDVAFLVSVVTKKSTDHYEISKQVDNYKQMLNSIHYDIRALLVKLADRLHNMRTLSSMRPDKQMKIAGETDFFYAPLANRLGLYNVKIELENLSFRYRCPHEYELIANLIQKDMESHQERLDIFTARIREVLANDGIKVQVKTIYRAPYSIWRKMRKSGDDFNHIPFRHFVEVMYACEDERQEKDMALRIYSRLTDAFNEKPCGIINYIDSPKENGYQSFHLQLLSDFGCWEEVHISSERMVRASQLGVVAERSEDNVRRWIEKFRTVLKDLEFHQKEGDFISINGSNGHVYEGEIPTQAADLSGDFEALMDLCSKYSRLIVRTNADTPHDAEVARRFGANGIGLCRTEHMFFDNEKIIAMREMILAEDAEGRKRALAKLLPYQKNDFKGIFKAMDGFPVNVRLLDPPLHEFVPHDKQGQETMAKEMGVSVEYIQQRVDSLCEHNPMLGHRGCRLGNTYPEITAMQTRAILTAAIELKKEGYDPHPEIMVPLTGILYEFEAQENVIREEAAKVFEEEGMEIPFKVGTMIEIPRAALTADRIATRAEYFSFGTNDLTQMTFGYSRDDIASFLPVYLEKKILKVDPFQVLDQNGVGQLVRMAVDKGREIRPTLKCGICGEHGGEPSSVKFCHKVGLDYVSCSPFRVPIARLAAAQAAVEE